jgi:hypothetical protein
MMKAIAFLDLRCHAARPFRFLSRPSSSALGVARRLFQSAV